MKYLIQFGIILAVSFVGEILSSLIDLPIPASIYGIIIMFILLCTKIIKLEQVKEVSIFLIEIMPVMFIPAAVGLLETWGVLSENLVPYITITIISTILVMGVSAKVTEIVCSRSSQKGAAK